MRMINPSESAEKAYLESVKRKLADALEELGGRVRRYAQEIQEQKAYLWEHKADMDHVEKVSARQSAHQMVLSGEMAQAARNRLGKLLPSPYFGRFDFRCEGDQTPPTPVYVGLHAFSDEKAGEHLIFDWRAPIATMFYDYETGAARYESPAGPVVGEILLKRQFRIREGRMFFMLESGISILDDVLQEELSRNSDERMKTIVATIQRDQNAIIRNEAAKVLIIQGVAGSGKTSIALHRIAFLLYRHRDRLTSQDILILSPNKVFADFISNVLPELGEEQIGELGMEELARELVEGKYPFQTFIEQSALLHETRDQGMGRRIEAKASLAFLHQVEAYGAQVEQARFSPVDVEIGGRLVPAGVIAEAFRQRRGRPVTERLRWAAEMVEHRLWVEYRHEVKAKERDRIRASVKKMYRNAALRTLYREFFTWLGRPELFKTARNGALEYADVFPLIYLKLLLDGEPVRRRQVKHLLIDEMQDYTPVQYAVIARLFPCEKTILGDVNQSVNPFSASSAETISQVFRQAEVVKLCKSYRSSYEITQFAQGISPNADLVPVERHGEAPLVLAFQNLQSERDYIGQAIAGFAERSYRTLGIICKTDRQAEQLHRDLQATTPGVHRLTAGSTTFRQGAVICTAHLAKGLEFDQVLVPQATADHYATALDRNLLYVACTRAMHRLIVTHADQRTRFIPEHLFRRKDLPEGSMDAKGILPCQKSTEAA
ncbi:MAG: AAA family ATPase [Syntrophobacterales bacterium]|nr:AAA family ATPase [Syntrophobacterales bacterium]